MITAALTTLFLLSLVLTGMMRLYALKFNIMDRVNERSSHTRPTPRGGGLAIVASFTCGLLFLAFTEPLAADRLLVLMSALLIAAVGFWDDHGHVSPGLRLLIHVLTSLTVIGFTAGFPPIEINGLYFDMGVFGYLIGVFFLTWWLNLFNFMDGTDGVAASETIFFASAFAGFLSRVDHQLFQVALYLAASAAGFLFWNRPKAKIFMGDVGSCYVGFLQGTLVLLATQLNSMLLFVGMILSGVFVVDATYTLLVRIVTRQSWTQAHCTHTYQIAAKKFGHRKVLFTVWLINIGWLLPIALGVSFFSAYSLVGLVLAYFPLVYLAFRFRAGLPVAL